MKNITKIFYEVHKKSNEKVIKSGSMMFGSKAEARRWAQNEKLADEYILLFDENRKRLRFESNHEEKKAARKELKKLAKAAKNALPDTRSSDDIIRELCTA